MNSRQERVGTTSREATHEDDHDLLTFSEAGHRLRLEIAAAAAEVERWAPGSGAAREAAEARLGELRSAAVRNSAQHINDANFETFFGYPGRASRDVPGRTYT